MSGFRLLWVVGVAWCCLVWFGEVEPKAVVLYEVFSDVSLSAMGIFFLFSMSSFCFGALSYFY